MHLQEYPTYGALKQHALHKVDMLMKYHPESKAANLLAGDEEDDDDWGDENVECQPCDDASEQLQDILALFKKKFGPQSRRPDKSSNTSRESRCLNCGETGHQISDCPKPEVPRNERPCFKCGEPGHISSQCKSTAPSSSGKLSSRFPPGKRPPVNAKSRHEGPRELRLRG